MALLKVDPLRIIDRVYPRFTHIAAQALYPREITLAERGNLKHEGVTYAGEWPQSGDPQIIFYSHPDHGKFNSASGIYKELEAAAKSDATEQVIQAHLMVFDK